MANYIFNLIMILLVSRDKRVHSLFRASWERTLFLNHYDYVSLFTSRGIISKFLTIIKNYYKLINCNKIIVFGIQDVLLYKFLLFPKPNMYFVITGFGRLWINKFTRFILIFLLKVFFRNESVAVLNNDDFTLLNNYGLNKLFHLHGEGHFLLDNESIENSIPLECSQKNINFVYVGRLLKSKGMLETIEFLKNFSKAIKINISFTIIGDYDFNNKDSVSESDIVQLNQYGINVIRLGYSTKPWELICQNSIFISLSYREGLPFSVLEALHYSHYCILSSVPGHNEFADIPGVFIIDNNLNYNILLKNILYWNNKTFTLKVNLRKNILSHYSHKNTIAEKVTFLDL